MRYLAGRLFLISFCIILAAGCSSEGPNPPSETRVQRVIGPEGGTILVTDSESGIYGLEVHIPAGALAQSTTITIEETRYSPSLQDGLAGHYHSAVRLSPAMTFLKDVEITFPIKHIPPAEADDGEILGAFYWDYDNASWSIVPPILIDGYRMTIETKHFSLWKWGSIFLHKVEKGHFESWFAGMVEDWNELMESVREEFSYLAQAVDDWEQWALCDHRVEILNHLRAVYEWSESQFDIFLSQPVVAQTCPFAVDCTTNHFLILNPKFMEWIDFEFRYFIVQFLFGTMPSTGSIVADLFIDMALKSMLASAYRGALRQLGCDYRCIFKNGGFYFYFYFWVHNASAIAHDGIILFHGIAGGC